MKKVIKEVRRRFRITQTELAATLRVSQSLISTIESGDRACSVALAAKIQKNLNLTWQEERDVADYIKGRS